jgi:hypothetical protein
VWLTNRCSVEPIDIRENRQAIDRVNMYASCKYRILAVSSVLTRAAQSGGRKSWGIPKHYRHLMTM